MSEPDAGSSSAGVVTGQVPARDRTRTVLVEIGAERARQDARWGEQNHPDGTGPDVPVLAALGDDRPAAVLRELARDHCDQEFAAGQGVFRQILTEEVFEAYAESDPAALRAELVQVAAVAVAWIEAIDRRT